MATKTKPNQPKTLPYRKGQKVTLSANPTIQLSKFEFLKPMASITFEVGDDPEQDLRGATEGLRTAIYTAMLTDLGVRNELAEILGSDADAPVSLETLTEFLMRKVGDHVVRVE
jgi:hypothetical protein